MLKVMSRRILNRFCIIHALSWKVSEGLDFTVIIMTGAGPKWLTLLIPWNVYQWRWKVIWGPGNDVTTLHRSPPSQAPLVVASPAPTCHPYQATHLPAVPSWISQIACRIAVTHDRAVHSSQKEKYWAYISAPCMVKKKQSGPPSDQCWFLDFCFRLSALGFLLHLHNSKIYLAHIQPQYMRIWFGSKKNPDKQQSKGTYHF